MASTITYESHPVDGRVAKVVTPSGETSPTIWTPVTPVGAYMSSANAGTGAIQATYDLPSLVRAGTATWVTAVSATGTDGPVTLPICTAIRLVAASDVATLLLRFSESN